MVALPDFDFFRKSTALAGESKKASALRAELNKTICMLMWVCRRIDEYNDDAERPLCPSRKAQCGVGASCSNCWLLATMSEVERG